MTLAYGLFTLYGFIFGFVVASALNCSGAPRL